MLGDDALVLDRHLIAGERDHPSPAGAMPRIERQLVERRRLRALTAAWIAAVRRAPGLGLVGRAAVDFPAHSRAPAKGATDTARLPSRCQPPPSVPSA